MNKEVQKERNNRMRLSFGKADAFVMFLIILLAFLVGNVFFWNTKSVKEQVAVIYKDGEKMQEVSLENEEEVWITGEYTNCIKVKDHRVAIAESDCPGMDCVHSGWIWEPGKSVICLPNRVEVRIEGKGEVDFIVR